MGITAMALGLMVSTLVAGCLLWTLLFHFEEFYPVAKDGISHPRTGWLIFLTLTGVTTVGIFATALLVFQQLLTS